MEEDRTRLLMEKAKEAAAQSFSPFSNYPVGAALLTKGGKIYLGCNVESSSYGLTVCAERNAIAAAIVAGERDFEAMAIYSITGAPPCGACRQVIWDVCGDIKIIIANKEDNSKVYWMHELLPAPFDETKFKGVVKK